MKKFIKILLLLCVLVFASNAVAKSMAAPIMIDGKAVYSDVQPYVVNGYTLVPLRLISENMGAEVEYNKTEQSVTVKGGNTNIFLVINSADAVVNGRTVTLDAPPEIKNGRTMVPLRFIAESFGCTVDYDAETKQITVVTGGADPAYRVENQNIPYFDTVNISPEPFEHYSELDYLGRAGEAFACAGPETMPSEKRGSIGSVKPSGWQISKYDFIDGKYLYNRCHLIAYQLTAENANERNLITGTRYMNTEGMLPFENTVADYIKNTGNHVLYKVTPVYSGDDLVANGVRMEAYSVEDNGSGVCFNVFVYNIQPGVEIDYSTGENHLEGYEEAINGSLTADDFIPAYEEENDPSDIYGRYDYILNTGTMKFHYPTCPSVSDIKEKNRQGYNGTREELTAEGYSPCGVCKP